LNKHRNETVVEWLKLANAFNYAIWKKKRNKKRKKETELDYLLFKNVLFW